MSRVQIEQRKPPRAHKPLSAQRRPFEEDVACRRWAVPLRHNARTTCSSASTMTGSSKHLFATNSSKRSWRPHSSWNSTRTRHDSGDGDVVGHHAHDAHPSFALAVPVAGELEADSPTAAEAGAPGNQGSEPGAAYGLASRQLPTNRPPRSRADANASDPA